MAFTIKQGDTAPELNASLIGANGQVQDLTGATVRFSMRMVGSSAAVISRASCTIVVAAAGSVRYVWQPGDTTTAGAYEGEFEVTFADSTIVTFPNNTYIPITITPQIA